MLDGFGPAGAQLPLGQGLEYRHVGQDELRLVEGSDEVLALGKIYGRLAADSGVHHREQAGRHLREGETSQIGRRDESGEVANDSAADSEDQVTALSLETSEPRVDVLRGRERLVLLSRRHDEQVRGDAGHFERVLRAPGLLVHALIGDDVRDAGIHDAANAVADLVDDLPADPQGVVSGRGADLSCELGIVHVFTLSPALSLRERGSVGWCSWQGRFTNRPYIPLSALRERG